MELIKESQLLYAINLVDSIPKEDSLFVLSNQLCLRETESGTSLETYGVSEDVTTILEEAERAFFDKNFRSAISLYKDLLKIQPDYYYASTLVGDAYFQLGLLDSAAFYFNNSINLNFIDYNAHWFLADTYERMGKLDRAEEEITIAHLLNVNHDDLATSMRRIYSHNKHPWKEWSYTPEYTLARFGDSISVCTTDRWLGYALCKALWAYEPGYSLQNFGPTWQDEPVVWPEEREAILMQMVTAEKDMKRIRKFIRKGIFSEFVVYEITAKKHPAFLLTISRADLIDIANYVQKYH